MGYSVALVMHQSLKELMEPILMEQARLKKVDINLIAVNAVYSEGVKIIEEFQDKLDLVICSRNHGELLSAANIQCPMHIAYPRTSDLLNIVLEVAKNENIIHCILRHAVAYPNLSAVQNFVKKYGIEVIETPFNNVDELDLILQQIICSGRREIICGTLVHDYLKKNPRFSSLKAHYLFTEDSLRETADQALMFLLSSKREYEWDQLSPFLNRISDIAMLIDGEGRICLANDAAKRSFPNAQYANKPLVREFFPSMEGNISENQIITDNDTVYQVRLEQVNFGTSFELLILKTIAQNVSDGNKRKKHLATFNDILGNSNTIQITKHLAQSYAATEETTLIIGETGVGKELFAQSIHNESNRSGGPFWAVNCAALPENLLESELFGYEEGAFTGANRRGKIGYFELANGGTLFLDEIGELSYSLQSKLLRVLEQRQVLRLGGSKLIPVDIRIICATNRDLKDEIINRNFRSDLYYRINVLQLFIAPLRERKDDIESLIYHFIAESGGTNYELRQNVELLLDIFKNYSWPGNIRELKNMVHRFVVMKSIFRNQKELREYLQRDLLLAGNGVSDYLADPARAGHDDDNAAEEITLEQLRAALAKCHGNRTKAAAMLGISRTTLWRYLTYDPRFRDLT